SLGRTVEPSDTGIPALGDLESREGVEPLELLRPVGEADTSGGLLSATLEDEVCGGPHLAIGENDGRTTLHDLDALDGIVEQECRAVLKENQCGHAIERRPVHLYREEGSVAAAREPGDFDVRAGLSAGRLRPDSRGYSHQIRGAFRICFLDLLGICDHHGIARIALLDVEG